MRRCGRCGTDYAGEVFARLPAVQRYSRADLAPHILGWPDDRVVDVRVCACCKSPIACLATALSG